MVAVRTPCMAGLEMVTAGGRPTAMNGAETASSVFQPSLTRTRTRASRDPAKNVLGKATRPGLAPLKIVRQDEPPSIE